MKRPIRKRSYLLLEIVISLMLITLCLFPLVKPHLAMRQSHALHLKEMKSLPLFQNVFCKIKRMLYEQQLTWKELTAGVEGEIDHVAYSISKLDSCNKPSLNGRGLLIQIKLTYEKIDQVHTLFLQEVSR